ncbi:hypothetical protein J1N35_008310 [Gossypium stocksii]|uniref:Reverse transcriptase domain-containing protein n=1 Tax=Gossypium stocksii TaxID=47602 RepID=A0A9D3W965_9ROSI|nr:hypothetical protein J1N35_008310 [Gossypium stocksii]
MAIKLDLEKAYDRISWDFIEVTLVAIGILEFLRKVIMDAISLSTTQILWNGALSQSFKPLRGIRQGCPLSPYLFVVCMEWLGHIIRSEISSGVEDNLCDQISHFFGLQKVSNLGRYLGVPLLHDRVTKSTLNFVVDKVRCKLQNWETRKLSFAGRVTLAKSVLLTIPNYFMQSLLVPKGVCDEIEKIARQFIWGGSMGNPRTALKDTLWLRVLRSKYGWKNQLPDSIHRSNCSHLWHSLSKVWPLLCKNLLWSIGDGSSIRGWKDVWIPNVSPLLHYVSDHSSLGLECSLREWVLPDGTWNFDLLRLWLPDDMIKRIASIPPPHPNRGRFRVLCL